MLGKSVDCAEACSKNQLSKSNGIKHENTAMDIENGIKCESLVAAAAAAAAASKTQIHCTIGGEKARYT